MNEERENRKDEEDEIDIIELLKTAWNGRKFIIRTLVVFAVFGVFVALFSPKQFTASTTLIPQTSTGSSKLGGLSSLASMAGFNLNLSQGSTELTPQVYPQIIQSAPFQLELMESSFHFQEIEKDLSLETYFNEYYKPGLLSGIKKYTLGLPGVIIKTVRGEKEEMPAEIGEGFDNKSLRLTPEQEDIRKMLDDNLVLDVNDKEGILTLSASFHEPELAAQVAQKAKELLQQYITEFKVEKATVQMDFIEERYNEKKHEFEEAQERLAGFRDRNKNVVSALAQTEETRLENEYQLAFSVYSELAQQLEQARIAVKEETPVFSTIKPVMVPLEKSKPSRMLILAGWIFFGLVVGLGWVFGKDYLAGLRKAILEEPKEEEKVDKGKNGYRTLQEKERKLHIVNQQKAKG